MMGKFYCKIKSWTNIKPINEYINLPSVYEQVEKYKPTAIKHLGSQ